MDYNKTKPFEELVQRVPALAFLLPKFEQLTASLVDLYKRDGVLYIAGNGGSCCDSEHIVGELQKGFRKKRPFSTEEVREFKNSFGEKGEYIAAHLQKGLRAIALNSHPGLSTAFANDVDATLVYAQQLSVMGRKGDIFIGISTGGNAANIEAALITAKMMGITTVLLTGNKHGLCEKYADMIIDAPAGETFIIQEYHLAIYHALCSEVENAFFEI